MKKIIVVTGASSGFRNPTTSVAGRRAEGPVPMLSLSLAGRRRVVDYEGAGGRLLDSCQGELLSFHRERAAFVAHSTLGPGSTLGSWASGLRSRA
jgi:hypothetical protein